MNKYTLMANAEKVIPNRFILSKVLTLRVRQLNSGYKPKVEVEEKTPPMEIALQEIIERKLEIVGIDKSEIRT